MAGINVDARETNYAEIEDDWLTGQACMIRPDGSIDPECEACQ